MSLASTAEYDAFGPWILEVAVARDLPRLFSDADLTGSRLALKVPRSIERRYASPSMDLYDYLVVARDDSLTILSRVDQGYSSYVVTFDEIVLIEVSVNLLVGRLRLLTADGSEFALPFNAVSESLIAKLVDLLRASAGRSLARANFDAEPPPARDDLGVQDVWITTQFRDLVRAQPDLDYFGGYGRTRLTPRGGFLARAAYLLRPAVLHAVIVCGSPTELVLLSSREWMLRGRGANYTRARTIIRPSSVTSVSSAEHPTFPGINVVTLHLGSALVEYPVRAGSRVEAALLALSAR
jgi:hypothetical protein